MFKSIPWPRETRVAGRCFLYPTASCSVFFRRAMVGIPLDQNGRFGDG